MTIPELSAAFAALNLKLVDEGNGLYGVLRPSGYVSPSGCDLARLNRLLVVSEANRKEGAYSDGTVDTHGLKTYPVATRPPRNSNVNRRINEAQDYASKSLGLEGLKDISPLNQLARAATRI